MKTYRVGHTNARRRGAIGIGHPVSEQFQAADITAAEMAFRARWEMLGGRLTVTELPGYCEFCGSGPECAVCGRGMLAKVTAIPEGFRGWADLGGEG